MITEAEIISIDHSSNTCVVNVPIFSTAYYNSSATIEAHFSVEPGNYCAYTAGMRV